MAVNDLMTELGKSSIALDEDMEKRVNHHFFTYFFLI